MQKSYFQGQLFQKSQNFGLGQANWADIFWDTWGIFGQTISTILALGGPYPWENISGCFSYKKLWFSALKHVNPKYDIGRKDLGNSLHKSVVGEVMYSRCIVQLILCFWPGIKFRHNVVELYKQFCRQIEARAILQKWFCPIFWQIDPNRVHHRE